MGDGTTTDRTFPVQIGTATNWASAESGNSHSLGLKTDGTLWAWGTNDNAYRTSPVQVETATNWVFIAAGGYHSLGLREDPIVPPFTPSPAFTSPNPTGSFDLATPAPGGARIAGWALDPESPKSIRLHIYVDGASATALTTNKHRPDVGQAFPSYGNYHGFDTAIEMNLGLHTVCIYGINIGPLGTNSLIGCRQVNVVDPTGSFDLATPAPGGARIAGWALDPESANSVDLHVYVDGAFATVLTANGDRPDIAQAFPGYGNTHGFDSVIPMNSGFHTVCAYSINIGGGENPLIGCRQVMIGGNPFGSFDLGTAVPGGARIAGWALDLQSARAVELHIYVDGAIAGSFIANGDRPDIAQAFPGYGNAHGFDTTVAMSPGFHTVCAYGINVGAGDNSLVGCRWVMIESNPFGNIDVVQSVSGGIQVGGWALDPQTADSIEIHIYVDGAIAGSFLANGDRPDIGQVFPGYGNAHGFNNVISATPGTHQVCVFGINKLAGNNALIGCRNT